ncbi:hypothetical protein A2567_00795 [Candidatus Azambacteria bacterium RIFOXYD1_FULL_42_11]|uniref:Uncharacterized protein n=3 Tax=Candidatus Azamiibacteriota TaxID=1752741 RepID=A0A0G1BK15_9BACT|nr:MAG: hypothetical protein UV10_C0001G0063 [Candidatus Azambacteria bacterium GW2011_GWA1_42_19]KKS75800.1 MAG: hypothetical protein UV48_C0006G0014 [Candidatus Azambacteria bacterium GW2011_GWA2_42_9]KKS88912.1 MAG: hypothetical protein UV62_C0001G0054 [Parcubacteria group bacterium GW2011_GWC1_43_11]OGD41761.1 MAG: hypothetical protein A2567_00795 [Candidatus Azambacteria bacterium RIFOXYD1_FULL_42_11]
MNVIAGILIGIINNSWLAIIVAPLLWGIVWCVLQFIYKNKLNNYLDRAKEKNLPLKWKMSHTQSFYFIEYLTSSTTALIFSVLVKLIKDLI